MKLILIAILVSLSAFAGVTPEQMQDIRNDAVDVMFELGANPRLNPRILSVKVKNQLGSRVTVSLRYVEDAYGKKDCTFVYDLNSASAVAGSGLCLP